MTGPTRVALVTGDDTLAGAAIAASLRGAGFVVRTDGGGVDGLDLAVYARLGAGARHATALADLDEEGWIRACEEPLREFVAWLQSVYGGLVARSGTAVLVAPSASQEGAAGLVAYTTAVEGQRLLAKSVARQWAVHGVRVLTVAPRLDALVDLATLGPTDVARTDPSLPAEEFGPAAVARVVTMLSAPAARALNGATVPVDGGALLAP